MIWRTTPQQIIRWIQTGEIKGYRDHTGHYFVEESQIQLRLAINEQQAAAERNGYLAATVTNERGAGAGEAVDAARRALREDGR